MFQEMTLKEIFVLTGLTMFFVFSALIAVRIISFLFRDITDTLIAVAITRKMVRSQKLVVAHKKHISPNEIVKKEPVMLHGHTPVGFITLAAPQKDMWVVTVDLSLGLFYYPGLAVEIDQTQWLELAPGDEVDNPHFGGIKAAAIVDPEIEDWLRRTAGAGV